MFLCLPECWYLAIIRLTSSWCLNVYWRGNFGLLLGEVEQWLERQCGATEKKNMAVQLFGADRDVVILLAGAGAIAILIILATMS